TDSIGLDDTTKPTNALVRALHAHRDKDSRKQTLHLGSAAFFFGLNALSLIGRFERSEIRAGRVDESVAGDETVDPLIERRAPVGCIAKIVSLEIVDTRHQFRDVFFGVGYVPVFLPCREQILFELI